MISVYAGSFEEVKPNEEPPLSWPSEKDYGINTVRKNVVFMKNFMFEELANNHAGRISFIHIYPGLVDGPGFYNADNPLWFKIVWRLVYPFLWATYMTAPDTCGMVMAFLATGAFPAKGETVLPDGEPEAAVGTEGTRGSGVYSVGQRADPGNKLGTTTYPTFQGKDIRKKIWDATMGVFERVERENASKQ